MINKGFTLLRLIVILAVLGVLIAIPGMIYRDYVSKAKIANRLSGIGNKKQALVELIKKDKKIDDSRKIILDTSDIKDGSMLIISPIIVGDNIYWGCNRIGLSASQVPHFCRLNDLTSPQISLINNANCELSQGVSYNEVTKKFNVNVKIKGKVVLLGALRI